MKKATLCNKYFHVVLMTLLVCKAYAQSQGENYVLSRVFLDEEGTRSVKSVQYHDGLGRHVVTAAGGKNTTGKYVYTMTEYDLQGRESKVWNPATGNVSPDMISPATMSSYSSGTYACDSHAFSAIQYDAAGRILFRSTPGDAWHAGGKGVATRYVTNAAGTVRKYGVDASGNLIENPTAYYPAKTLTGESVTDEDGHVTLTYKDLMGNVVLERRDSCNDTYYVYDKGMLRIVVPPLYQNETRKTDALLYKYKYDGHGRCTEKTLPGCAPVRYWYDRYGRVSFMQDARLEEASQYRFFLYDGLNRLVIQGLCRSTSLTANSAYIAKAVFGGSGSQVGDTGYYLQCGTQLPVTSIETVNYYDGYQFLQLPALAEAASSLGTGAMPQTCVTTLLTAQTVASTDGGTLTRVMFYDEKGRCTGMHACYPDGITVHTETAYSFTGKPLEISKTVCRDGQTYHTLSSEITYDSGSDLLLNEHLRLDNNIPVLLYDNAYNGLGQLDMVTMGNVGRLSAAYRYDVHGWLTACEFFNPSQLSGAPVFREILCYADGQHSSRYNGDISEVVYKTPDKLGEHRGFIYNYDGLDRLTAAVYKEGKGLDDTPAIDYSETFTYDENSNITALTRKGRHHRSPRTIDNLTFVYEGNQLMKITDSASNNLLSGSFDFKDGADEECEYTFDGCGSMTSDLNKGIIQIDYDFGGMPRRVQFSNGNVTEYVYTADGVKLKTVHRKAVDGITVDGVHELTPSETAHVDSTMYADGFEITNGFSGARYFYSSGYLECDTLGHYVFNFYAKDHLGNVRAVFSDNGTLRQVNNYYAYGGLMNDVVYVDDTLNPIGTGHVGILPGTVSLISLSTGAEIQSHKYNGKELDRMFGTDLYDYGARHHDAKTGRFTTMDPLAEKYYSVSPYMYCMGNPVKFIDPNGEFICIPDENDNLYYYDMDKGLFFNSEGDEYSGELYKQLFKSVTTCLHQLSSTETGMDLVSFLADNKSGVIIQYGIFSENIPDGHNNNVISVVGFSPKDRDSDNPAFIALGHELAHSQDRFNGTIDMSDWIINPDKNGHPIPKAEIYATFVENKLRKENNLPLRQSYTLNRETYSWDFRTRIIDNNNRSLFFDKNGLHLPKYKIIRKDNRYQF